MEIYKKIMIILMILLSVLFVPLMLNQYIFNYAYLTKVSYDGWASFFGSYIGGVIGGIGTLIAMYITLKQTQKQLLSSIKKDIYNERRKESNEIVDLVAAFLADVSVYYDNIEIYLKRKSKIKNKKGKYEQLLEKWREFSHGKNDTSYTNYLCKLKEIGADYECARAFFEQRDNEFFEQNRKIIYSDYEKSLYKEISEIEKEEEDLDFFIKKIREKKIIGCQSFWVMEIKLSTIDDGEDLWNLILSLRDMFKNEFIEDNTKKWNNEDINYKDIVQKIKKEASNFLLSHCKV